ncbi:MAG: hypothetical protein II875_04045 [Clostridia bacterium]|nr:hypothetical protein [Clostridia bacterium]
MTTSIPIRKRKGSYAHRLWKNIVTRRSVYRMLLTGKLDIHLADIDSGFRVFGEALRQDGQQVI